MTSNETLRKSLEHEYPIPPCFWSTLCGRSNGYFGCEDVVDEAGHLNSHNSWFRFQIKQLIDRVEPSYVWSDLSFLSFWQPDKHKILCFDINPIFQNQIFNFLANKPPSLPSDIYFLHVAIIEIVLGLFDHSVWTLRDHVRDIERKRMSKTEPRTDYPRLHEIARHACHSSETLAVAIDTVEAMHDQYRDFLHCLKSGSRPPCSTQLGQYLGFQKRMIKGLHARSMAIETRLNNELNLAINKVAQEESATTIRISQATQNDGAAMKAVAVTTLVFLPSTFLSTIFSMSFFSYEPSKDGGIWHVSGKIWLYWLLVVPLTAAAMGSWVWWQRRDLSRRQS